MSIHDWFSGPDGKVVVAGAIGSVVGALTQEGQWLKKCRIFAVGSLSAYFLSPLVVPSLQWGLGLLGVDSTKVAGLSGFLAGAFGLMFMEFLIQAFHKKFGGGSSEE